MNLTSLRWTKVFAWGGCPWLRATSLFDAQGAALVDFALKSVLGCIGLVRRDHLDETKTARFTGVWVTHDAAGLDISIFLKKALNLLLGKARVNASDEKVGASVGRVFFSSTRLRSTFAVVAILMSVCQYCHGAMRMSYRLLRPLGDALRMRVSPSRSAR